MYSITMLEQLGRYDSLDNIIYIVADPTPVDGDHDVHVCHCIVCQQRPLMA